MRLYFRKLGAGSPLIILHGLFGSSDNWMTLGRRLAGRFTVYLADLRNHGRSPHDDVFDIPALAEDLGELLASERIGRPDIVGHSLGGKVAMQFGLAHSGQVNKLIVVDVSPAAKSPRMLAQFRHIIAALKSLDPARIASRQQADQLLSSQIPEVDVRQFLLKNLERRRSGGYAWRLNLSGIAANLDAVGAGVVANEPFPGPALFLRGGLSPHIQEEDETAIRRAFPHARITTIADAGHWVHAEAPRAVLQAIESFLT